MTYADLGEQIIAEIGSTEFPLRVTFRPAGERPASVDIRKFWTNDQGEVLPSKKGIRFTVNKISDVIDALEDIQRMVPQEEDDA